RPKSLCARTFQGVTCRVTGFVVGKLFTASAMDLTRPLLGQNRKTMHRSYLIAPMVKPAMKRSTKKLYRMATGTLAMKQPAMREPQKYTSPWTRKVGTPTLTVIFRTEEMKVTA